MKLLAFDTSTDVMSIAVTRTVDGALQVWEYTGAGGAKASLTLIPIALDLLKQAGLTLRELDAICFGCGPGSFTGLRTACAVAQGLAFGAERQVLPINSLLAVAEDARYRHFASNASAQVTAVLDARMNEMYAASFSWNGSVWMERSASALVKPEDFRLLTSDMQLAGNVFAEYGARLKGVPPNTKQFEALPTAAAMLRLAPILLAAGAAVAPDDALPVYIRDNVAQTTAERTAIKEAKAALQSEIKV
jgi:tRNA threonylcarbamoyladenosine biosynthesis protein TsaB